MNANFTYANFTGFSVKHRLILNYVWYLSDRPEHLNPREVVTQHLDWISKQIGSCQLICVCVKSSYEYLGL